MVLGQVSKARACKEPGEAGLRGWWERGSSLFQQLPLQLLEVSDWSPCLDAHFISGETVP